MRFTRLADQATDYLTAREELHLAEVDLMRHREQVPERRLPERPVVADHVFQEGPAGLEAGDAPGRVVLLDEVFTPPDRPLVVYHSMYGKRQTPRPTCTMWIDGYNEVVPGLGEMRWRSPPEHDMNPDRHRTSATFGTPSSRPPDGHVAGTRSGDSHEG
jgi:predicted dithiol-disulfide oxidoreductase (DUF899 family)